jgi:polar amino acid transport system substrate-binding protein
LPNRILFEDRLSTALVSARHNQQILAVVFFSFDQFKKIYNTLGNLPGLQLLQEVAERLKIHIPRDTTVARFEADEFALLLTQIENVEDIIEFISNINLALKSPIVVESREVFITASIGISVFPNDGMDTQTLLNNASVALSRVKEQGGNNYEFYATGMNAKAIERLEMENKLRRAVEHQEFEVYYQPKVNINTKKIVGMEALIRWQHPEFGIILPSDFISLAEETGIIIPIGEWILRAACIQNKIWIDAGFNLEVSVNLSARQFQQPNLLQVITEILEETDFPPELLNLEVTESSIMKNADSAISMLTEIKKKGIKISIDDFGTGYSSLGYLKSLPIDTLKIDKSFVNDVTTNQDDAALVMAIITLAHNLRLKVIAEGVETEEQFRFLHLLRCDECQGYLFSKPVPSDDFKNLLY